MDSTNRTNAMAENLFDALIYTYGAGFVKMLTVHLLLFTKLITAKNWIEEKHNLFAFFSSIQPLLYCLAACRIVNATEIDKYNNTNVRSRHLNAFTV